MDWGQVVSDILIAVLIPVATIIGALIAKLLKKGIERIDNNSIQQFAWIAVRWVEDNLGTDTGTGSEKLEMAVEWLAKRFPKARKSDIEAAIRAAYQSFSAEVGNGASSPTE